MIMKKLFSAAAILSAILFSSCEKLGVTEKVGENPNYTRTPSISLMADNNDGNVVAVDMVSGDGFSTKKLFAKANCPLTYDRTIILGIADEAFVDEYSKKTGIEYSLLPKPFYDFIGGGAMNIRSGVETSAKKYLRIYAKNPLDNVLAPGRYLLPITASSANGRFGNNIVLIDICVRERYTDPDGVELYKGEDMFSVFYLNTSDFDPRLANDMILENSYDPTESKRGLGNIINLLTANLSYDETTGKVRVKPSNDLRYVLEHAAVRIRPVQESGRKVCICIEGSGRGIGFCNLNDKQIVQFTASVVRLVEEYGLDGVNLWDRKSGYGKEGCPQMNTTSYPKLIKALREALGPFHLLTLTDYEEPTAYFDDVQAMGGVKVGEYLDYAWSGYCDSNEPIQIIDPWHQELPQVSKLHPRKPIAGLSQKRYGCIMDAIWFPNKNGNIEQIVNDIKSWRDAGYNSRVSVFYQIRSIIQDQYEGYTGYIIRVPVILSGKDNYINYNLYLKRFISIDQYGCPDRYNKWKKDW